MTGAFAHGAIFFIRDNNPEPQVRSISFPCLEVRNQSEEDCIMSSMGLSCAIPIESSIILQHERTGVIQREKRKV
jgi:hypothetical protein